MKRWSPLLVMVMLSLTTPAYAQRIGDGRFFRRMLGMEKTTTPQDYEKQRTEALRAQQQQQSANGQQLRAEQPNASRSTQPAPSRSPYPPPPNQLQPNQSRAPAIPSPGVQSQMRPVPTRSPQPTPAQSPPASPQHSILQRPDSVLQRPVGPNPRTETNLPNFLNPFSRRDTSPSDAQDGFGIALKLVGDNVVVSDVDASGTAAKAGVHTGDIVKSIGSIPMATPTDVKQFSEVLKAGDQVEFEIVRRGKDSKILVPFLRELPADMMTADRGNNVDDIANSDATGSDESLTMPSLPLGPAPVESDLQELREVVQLQKQIINALQARLKAIEQQSD